MHNFEKKTESERRYIILIPARSGSKGLVDKNIKKLNGKPLLHWSMAAAEYMANLAQNVTTVISSDSIKYLQIARSYSTDSSSKFQFHHRSNLSSADGASMVEVVDEILLQYCEKGLEESYTLILLQPTSPIRSKLDLERAFGELIEINRSTAIVTRANLDLGDLFFKRLKFEGVESVLEKLGHNKAERRQDREIELLNLDGSFYGFPLFLNGVRQEISRCFGFPENLVISVLDQNVEVDSQIDFNVAVALHRYYACKQEFRLVGL